MGGPGRRTWWNGSSPCPQRLAKLLVSVLEQGLPPSRRVIWLQSIRILSRDRSCLDSFTSRRSLQALACYAGISASQGSVPEPLNMDVVLESLKCLCNLVLSSPVAQALAAEAGLVVRLAERVGLCRQSSFPHDVQFFDLRLLFLLTALRTDVRQQLFQELQGVRLLTRALELTLGMTEGERHPELLTLGSSDLSERGHPHQAMATDDPGQSHTWRSLPGGVSGPESCWDYGADPGRLGPHPHS